MNPTDPLPTTIAKQDSPDIFSPSSIAVIGASANPAKIGSQILTNIIKGGYTGHVYPINPKGGNIQGLQTYPSVLEVHEPIDHAVIAIPAKFVPKVVAECGRKGIKGVTIISAGFRETGPEGMKLEEKIIKTANEHEMDILGPNCLGFINTDIDLNATFSAADAQKGNVILFSQSGAFGTAILDWATQVNLGFKYFISLGNKSVIDETYLLGLWEKTLGENNENIIFAGYLEDIRQGRDFMKTVSKLSQKHPVIILKPGKTEHTQKAISSHTGAMATNDTIIDTALRQSGCIRVDGIQRLFDTVQMLSRQSIPRGNRVAIVTNAGGPGVVTTDLIEESLLEMADLSETTQYTLQQRLPPAAGINNPIDVLGDATAERYERALEAVLVDDNVDCVIVLLTPQAVTEVEKTAGVIAEKYRKYPFKPIAACYIGGETAAVGVNLLNRSRMPIFSYPRQAVHALSYAYRYRESLSEKEYVLPETRQPSHVLPSDSNYVVGKDAEDFVSNYGIRVPQAVFLSPHDTPDSEQLSITPFPVAVKIISPALLHKTELDGVRLDINDPSELETAIRELRNIWEQHNPGNGNYSIQIQEMISGGELLILGFKRDPTFGPVIVFGAGGILTELLHDTAQYIPPVTRQDAIHMIEQTKIHTLLTGFRKQEAKDIDSIADSIIKLSTIAIEHPEIEEFDINPFIVLNEGAGGYAADIKIIRNTTARNGS